VTLGATGRLLGSSRVQAWAEHRLRGRARTAVRLLTELTGARTGAQVWRSFVAEQRTLTRELDHLGPGLAGLVLPTVILNGSADHVVAPHVADQLTSAIVGATHVVVAGAHHLLPIEHPEALSAAVRQVSARAEEP
jgi:pimeloyl-ACP methyl ester carboxylesterase